MCRAAVLWPRSSLLVQHEVSLDNAFNSAFQNMYGAHFVEHSSTAPRMLVFSSDTIEAHMALRHLKSQPSFSDVLLVLPHAWMRRKAFTPWLTAFTVLSTGTSDTYLISSSGSTAQLPGPWCLLRSQARPAHTASPVATAVTAVCAGACAGVPSLAATFDVKVDAHSVRALFDTGSDVSCVRRSYLTQRNIKFTAAPASLSGLNGTIMSSFGHVDLRLQVKGLHVTQRCVVMDSLPAAHLQVLLGNDFLASTSATIHITPERVTCQLTSKGRQAELRRDFAVSACASASSSACAVHVLTSKRAQEKLCKSVLQQRAPAFAIQLQPVEDNSGGVVSAVKDTKHLSPCVAQVVARHTEGTLSGRMAEGVPDSTYTFSIDLLPGATPRAMKQYRLTPLEKDALAAQVQDLLAKGWINPSVSPWSAPILFVPKPDGSLRLCVDFRYLNSCTVKNAYPLPNIEELLDKLTGAKVFSSLDLKSGYHQIGIDLEDRSKTAFRTPFGHFEWNVMPFGLTNAPAIFQRAMDSILGDFVGDFCLVYLDDVLIYSSSPEEHARHLDLILTKLQDHNLVCHPDKCQFELSELRYLGYIVGKDGLKPDPAKVQIVQDWVTPKDTGEVRSFLGLVNYFRRFIPRYDALAAPLYAQTRKEPPPWDRSCDASFAALKRALTNAPTLRLPDMKEAFHVFSDASVRGIGGVLMQTFADGMHPIAFIGRRQTSAEVNYITTEQELLALVYCLKVWRCYLEGLTFVVHTDHQPLAWLHTQTSLSRRQARWVEYLGRFNFTIQWEPRDKNVVADCMSKALSLSEPTHVDHDLLECLPILAPAMLPDLPPPPPYSLWWQHVLHAQLDPTARALPLAAAATLPTVNAGVPATELPLEPMDSDDEDLVVPYVGEAPDLPLTSVREQNARLHERDVLLDTFFANVQEGYRLDAWFAVDSNTTSLRFEDQYWWKDHALVIPDHKDLRQSVLYWHHDQPWCAHMGIKRTLDLMQRAYWWPTIRKDVEAYVKTCHSCQTNKIWRHNTQPLLSPLSIPSGCWRTIGVDLIQDLPPSSGFTAICVFVDHFSKAVRLVPTTISLNAAGFADIFFREVFPHYGFPLRVVSDQGTQWNNAFFKDLCQLLDINLAMSSSFHPQTNAATERSNAVVAEMLRHFVAPNHNDWSRWLPLVEFAINNSYHDAIGCTPFSLNRLTQPLNPMQALLARKAPSSPAAEQTAVQARANYYRAHQLLYMTRNRMKQQADAYRHLRTFTEGEKVLLNTKFLSLQHPTRRNKLIPRWIGPFLVERLVGKTALRLKLPKNVGLHPTVHYSICRHYNERDTLFRAPPPLLVGEDLEYEVEKILNHKLVGNSVQFLILWKGHSHDDASWQPDVDLVNCDERILEYLNTLNRKSRPAVEKRLPKELLKALKLM